MLPAGLEVPPSAREWLDDLQLSQDTEPADNGSLQFGCPQGNVRPFCGGRVSRLVVRVGRSGCDARD